jgi:MFS family permease
MTTRYAAGPRAGIAQAAPTLPPDPFARRPRLRGRGSRRLSGRPAVFVLASLIVALLASSAAPTPLYAIYQAQWHFTPITTTVVFGVYAVTVLAVSLGSAAVFFAGSAIAGAGFGSGFQGGIRMVVPLAAPHQRAGLVSLLYVVSYLGLGLPAVLAGFGVVHGGGLVPTTRYYGAAVIALAALALFGLLKNRPSRAAEPAAAPAQGIR